MPPVKSFFASHYGHELKLGWIKSPARWPRLSLANYLLPGMPSPPASVDYSGPAQRSISQMYLNDRYGDCVIACMAHITGILTAGAGNEVLFTDDQVTSLYSSIGGFVPGNPATDQGCNEQTALAWWQQHGAPSGSPHKILGSLAVNPKNPQEYRTALWLFSGLMYGIPLPDSWIADPRPGFIWDADRPNQNNGHCVSGIGFNSQGVQVATWGFTGTITDAAHAADVDELYVVLSQDQINAASQKAPNGIDWYGLVEDFNSLGGNVAPPAPSPPPGPGPTPPPNPPPTPVPPAPRPGKIFSLTFGRSVPKGGLVEIGRFRAPVAIPAGKFDVVPTAASEPHDPDAVHEAKVSE